MLKGIFSQSYNTKSATVNNAIIQLGDIDDTGKGRKFKSRFIKDGLVKIEGHGIVLLKKETLDKSLKSMIGSPVIIEHQDVTDKNADKIRCGVISDAYFNEPDGWYYAEGIIWDDKAISLINDGWSVSCSYDFLAFNDEGGEENNIKYDKEFTELNFTHLAIVNNPRYERANIVFNSKDEEKGKWVTIKGNHIFIPDGKSLDEVIKEKGWGDKEDKQSDIPKDYKENTSHYGKKEHQEEIISLYEGLKNPNKSETRKKEDRAYLEHHLKELNKYSDISGIHLSDEETKRENKIKEIKKELNKEQSETKEVKKERLRIIYKEDKDPDGSIVGIFEDEHGEYQALTPTVSKTFKTIAGAERFLTSRGFKNPNKTNNSKEQDMILLDELKKLITKVENNKENEEMIDNEKVDKRKLIDEVGGILKGKVDDEIIRTIIKKMEEASYNDSEASADNKKVKNEDDEEKKIDNEEEKKDDKVDNEEKEKEEVKNKKKVKNEDEEDEEKVEELKKEEKKDVENKCKNSKETSTFDKINAIYNSVRALKPQIKYTSRQEKLDNAVEYFKN